MKLEKYPLKAEDSLMVFEFLSLGPNGNIPKLVKFSETNLKDLYNLAFGDKDLNTGDINDLAISNNGDSEKILASVVSAVYAFTDQYPNAYVYATGSTKARTRLYRMGVAKHLIDVVKDFDVYGLLNNEWEKFEKETDYEAFLAKRKKVTLHYEHRRT
jgi:hypothetical protein